jgi:hypothetical protein
MLNRREDISQRTEKTGPLDVETTKLGYAYVVVCPYYGYRFRSELKKQI